MQQKQQSTESGFFLAVDDYVIINGFGLHPAETVDALGFNSTAFPLTIKGNALPLIIGAPKDLPLKLISEAAVWHDDGETAHIYRSEQDIMLTCENLLEIPFELVPQTPNHISLTSACGTIIYSSLEVFSYAVTAVIPTIYMQAAPVTKTVTEAELNTYLDQIKLILKKVSIDLWQCVRAGVSFDNIENSMTGKIDQTLLATPANTRIRLSRRQWRSMLLAIKCATAANRADVEEGFLRQALSQLLHEASHRKGMVEGVAHTSIPKEEKRNTESLITKMLELLAKMTARMTTPTGGTKPGLDDGKGLEGEPDLTIWFERILTVIKRQKVYRYEWSAKATLPWGRNVYIIEQHWGRFQRELDTIRADATKTPAQKQADAVAAYNRFKVAAATDIAVLEAEFGVTITYEYDTTTLRPKSDLPSVVCNGTWGGNPLPTSP
ncbi:hypothetical protein [Kordiimonas aquimaris]|uniref:hypothetical protein n=1 Tax=Kordiimonas aquimaris TaxID=707591 RepID=UPI0021CE3A54|nr:hypothetical protein [Kordiimonas aquimaris]